MAEKRKVNKPVSKQQPKRKKAPVKSGSQVSGSPKKKRPQGTGMAYPRSRYPAERSPYREPAGDYNPSMPYAGRGQMSYDDFVRNREFFGGDEEEYAVHQRRRTGGTVKNKPQQGRNKPTG